MKIAMIGATALVLAAAIPVAPALGKGTPQRSAKLPPGLARLLAHPNHGILTALQATAGSNSRLQERPVSP